MSSSSTQKSLPDRKSKEGVKPDYGAKAHKGAAPERDFQRVPNSITRQAMPEGTFKGKSKQVWDYLWSVSRGAIIPCRTVRKSRSEIKAGSGLGSMVTVDSAISHLKSMGLIAVKPSVGSLVGNEYEIFTPEEVDWTTTSISSTASTTSLTQKLDVLDIPESSISRATQLQVESTTCSEPKTFLKTSIDDETHTLEGFTRIIIEASRNVVGGSFITTAQEGEHWNELGQLLAEELTTAAQRTDAVSSVPAFLTAHLRRRLAQKTRASTTTEEDQKANTRSLENSASEIEAKAASKEIASERKLRLDLKSRFSLENCRRYAEHLHKTGQGITNPGGYATTIHRTGEADELIERFLHPPAPSAPLDASQCPDCNGTGWWYPKGQEMGVAKCKHERLLSIR